MEKIQHTANKGHMTRRRFLFTAIAGCSMAGLGIWSMSKHHLDRNHRSETFIAKAGNYYVDFKNIILRGLKELGIDPSVIQKKRILLKPNLVETMDGALHINTHPSVVQGAIEAFFSLGASEIIIAEGPGHCRDSLLHLEESGMAALLKQKNTRFVDINYDIIFSRANLGKKTQLVNMLLPQTLKRVDWIVSMAKMKTHHWAGATLSMKNMFGLMPGSYYGWPKNVLHCVGIDNAIIDINATVRPHFAIIDGVIGMEGDGPIMGTPINSGVLVMGHNFPSVDATCCRLMGIDPYKILYLVMADKHLGTIHQNLIRQRGEKISATASKFAVTAGIPAHRHIHLVTKVLRKFVNNYRANNFY